MLGVGERNKSFGTKGEKREELCGGCKEGNVEEMAVGAVQDKEAIIIRFITITRDINECQYITHTNQKALVD